MWLNNLTSLAELVTGLKLGQSTHPGQMGHFSLGHLLGQAQKIRIDPGWKYSNIAVSKILVTVLLESIN